jgi:hypothetical protein
VPSRLTVYAAMILGSRVGEGAVGTNGTLPGIG